ncbi:MAG TPA: M56 family metallopeptidase [Flavobacterium sp.]|jgi:hypothetical protein
MEALLVHLVKSAALIGAFFLAYHFLLRKETFFKSNRWYLLAGLVTSALLPLVTYKKVIWVEVQRLVPVNWSPVPADIATQPVVETFEIDWMVALFGIYFIGVLIFIMKFLFDCYAISNILKGKTVQQNGDYRLVDISDNVSPFSFCNYIVYNSALFSETEMANILEHEKVHCRQFHTADVIFARLFCIVFWWNPFIWLYKKAMMQNLEFIADSEAVRAIPDRRSYQITLVKITTHNHCVSITNHFYQSLIKKRIVMLNKNQSKRNNCWKYFLIVPALAAFMFYFQVRVIAQEKQPLAINVVQDGIAVKVDKNTTDAQMKSEAERVERQHGVKLKFSKVKRNNAGEIVAIKAEFKDTTGKKGVTQVSGNEPIEPIHFFKSSNGAIGFNKSSKRFNVLRSVNGNDPVVFSDPSELPEIPEHTELSELPELPGLIQFSDANGEHIVISSIDGKGRTKVIVNGEVVADVDVDRILAEMDPIMIDGINVLPFAKGSGQAISIDTQKITSEAMKLAEGSISIARREMARDHSEAAKERAKMPGASHQDQGRRELEAAKREIEQAKREMEQSKREMEQARRELEQQRRELEQSRRELENSKK